MLQKNVLKMQNILNLSTNLQEFSAFFLVTVFIIAKNWGQRENGYHQHWVYMTERGSKNISCQYRSEIQYSFSSFPRYSWFFISSSILLLIVFCQDKAETQENLLPSWVFFVTESHKITYVCFQEEFLKVVE